MVSQNIWSMWENICWFDFEKNKILLSLKDLDKTNDTKLLVVRPQYTNLIRFAVLSRHRPW